VPEDRTISRVSFTLLDHFAMASLTGILVLGGTAGAGAGGHVPSEAARTACEAAEAMMKEREKHNVDFGCR